MIEAIQDIHRRLSVLHVLGPLSPRDWLERALDEGAGDGMHVMPAPSLSVALEYLRDQPYDVIVVDEDASDHPPAELLSALHAGSNAYQAVVVLAEGDDRSAATDYLLAGAQAYLCLRQTTTRELVWQLHSVASQSRCERDNQRLRAWHTRADERQQDEVLELLQEQLTRFTWAARHVDPPLGAAASGLATAERVWVAACRELLQAYLVMGKGQLAEEVGRLAERLHRAGESLPAALLALTHAMQELVGDRGPRSARHIVHRGNLLLFDLVLAWADRLPARTVHESLDYRAGL